ncbi:MAG: cob(I)yrinic acid a,c-diamide adenosyltransferase, partial [Thermoplasmata archaeon]|nr:cob(I)yrinic acid a,c-diamide adenosyltransferase [Thermoplasmata archaeon]
MRVSDLGLIQVYTGTGKGKTTASLGLAMRACGHGLKVYMIQYMKGRIDYGELKAAEKIGGLTIEQFGRPDFVDKDNPAKEDIKLARDALARSKEVILGGKY